MTIKQQGGIFGRNPTFNEIETNDVYVANKLGVGTTSPVQKAEIVGNGNVYTRIRSTTSAFTGVDIGQLQWGTGVIIVRDNQPLSIYTNGTEKWQFTETGNLKVKNSGNGIDFSATSGTGTSELFDDYEEGTWTPTDASGAGLTFSAATGTYTKIGDTVTLTMTITYPSNLSSAVIAIGGAPFTAATAAGAGGFVTYTNSGIDMQLYYSGSSIRAYINNGASVQNLSVSTDSISATLIYRAA